MDPDRLVENATAPSAGGSPDSDGKVWMGKRISEKVNGEARSGSGSLSVSVSKVRGMGFGHEKPARKSVLLRY